ncbi:hypothetical protein GJAV_G00039150 [Gymnothorax javanicus]|nr:hypothetical protein GJAV_G00039150 [Gymnothorax javanicus]
MDISCHSRARLPQERGAIGVGLSNAAPHLNAKDASRGWRLPRAALETTVDILNISTPSHLPTEKPAESPISRLTPAPSTTAAGRTAVAQPSTTATIVSTTVPHKIINPISENGDSEAGPVRTTSSVASRGVLPEDKIGNTTVIADGRIDSPATTTKNRQAAECNCSTEGVLDPEECDEETGQCACLAGHTGLQCEECEEGHFNNGSTGCLPCGCDSFGAVDDRCDSAGACVCKPGVFGPKCDDCQTGFFRFSSTGCQPCQCSNHSSYCHPQSGICLDCQDNTKGPSCEDCAEGFYRRTGATLTDACTACPCSLNTSTGGCHPDPSGGEGAVCEQCLADFDGPLCDRCRAGFFRSRNVCLPCDCNGNANATAAPNLCHPETGHCLSCTNHTAGPHCERCADGYTGNALMHNCTRSDIKPPVKVTTTPSPATNTSVKATTTSSVKTTTTNTTAGGRVTVATSMGGTTDNGTTTVSEVSWGQFKVVVLAVIAVAVVLLMFAAGGAYSYREYRNRKLNAPFWTIELKEDNISFSSYHDSIPNADASGLLEEEPGMAPPNGQLALSSPRNNVYKS